MFADDPTGKTKGDAIPYAWGEGIKVTANAGEGKWYKVDLYGKFDPATGKSAEGNADANILVSNPLDEKATVDVTAYVGDNETSRHFTLQPGEFKTMNIGAGMLVRMGIQYVYMFIVMDVTITPAQAEKIEVVVEDAPSNSTPFIPEDFVWGDNWATTHTATGNNIAANKETWIMIDRTSKLTDGWTFKLYAQNLGSAATTIYGGLATDCPATNIQEQEKNVAANGIMSKELDLAMLDMMPDIIYVRLKANQPLKVWAEEVEPTLPEQPLFSIEGESIIAKNTTYNLTDSILYKVGYGTLTAPEYFVTKVEVKNNGSTPVTLTGKVVKNATGDVYSAIKRTTTIQPGQTITKEIDNTLMANLETGDEVYALITGGNSNVEFKLIEVCTEEDPCIPAEAIAMTLSTTEIVSKDQAANSTKWYAVNIVAARDNQADIVLTMDAGNEVAEVTVDVAAACVLGEPTQTYTGKSTSTSKTLNYSLFQSAGDVIYIRVHTDKAITVNAEVLTSIRWNGTEWQPQTPATDGSDAVRIEGDLPIDGTLNVLGLTLAGGNINIANTGKLIVGAEGIKGSESVDQIIVEDGGILLIDQAATTNNKPFVTAKKGLEFGPSPDASPILAKMHQLVALSVSDREENLGIYYYNWDIYRGWITSGTFYNTFTGYFIYKDVDVYQNYTLEMKGRLASNKNANLSLPGHGWYPFGNSWLSPIKVSDILPRINGAQQAVHLNVAKHTVLPGGAEMSDDQYVAVTAELLEEAEWAASEWAQVKPMQGFFLYTDGNASATLDYSKVYPTPAAAPIKATNPATDNRNKVAVVLRGNNRSDFVYMIEGNATNANKMMTGNLSIYAEDGLAQVANENLIGTMLTIETNAATEYTLSFTMVNGETLVLQDMETGAVIDMTADNTYTFFAAPNSVSERFQVIGRKNMPTAVENNAAIEGANKFIENGRVVIIKNGVKYNVLGAQL